MTDVTQWCASPAEDLLWAAWDGEYIVFHRPSGKTHLLNDVSHWLLTDFLRAPRSIAEIAGAMRVEAAVDQAALAAEINETLARFEQLGLVART